MPIRLSLCIERKSMEKLIIRPYRASILQKKVLCFPHTILFKIITRMKLLFSNCLGGYSYSFQRSSELISITVTVPLFF